MNRSTQGVRKSQAPALPYCWLTQTGELLQVTSPGCCLGVRAGGCYCRFVVLVFCLAVRAGTWCNCFPKNIFGFKTEGQQFASTALAANSVVRLVPPGQQHLKSRSIDLRRDETTKGDCQLNLPVSPHFPHPKCLSAHIPFLAACLPPSLSAVCWSFCLSFSISLSLFITVFNNVLVSSSLFPQWIPLENAFERKQLYTSLPLKLCWHLFQRSKPYNMDFQSFQTQTCWR